VHGISVVYSKWVLYIKFGLADREGGCWSEEERGQEIGGGLPWVMAGVVVVGSKKSGGTTKRRCGHRSLPPAAIASRIACGYDCRRCQLGWCKANPSQFSSFLHQRMRARGAVSAVIIVVAMMRGFARVRIM